MTRKAWVCTLLLLLSLSAILTWAFDVSAWIWGTSWLATGVVWLAYWTESIGWTMVGGAAGILALVAVIGSGAGSKDYAGPALTESRCIEHMNSQHTAALSTNGCRQVMGIAKYCTAMATVIDW